MIFEDQLSSFNDPGYLWTLREKIQKIIAHCIDLIRNTFVQQNLEEVYFICFQ